MSYHTTRYIKLNVITQKMIYIENYCKPNKNNVCFISYLEDILYEIYLIRKKYNIEYFTEIYLSLKNADQ